MTYEKYELWKTKNGKNTERIYFNGIAYDFVTMNDEWIAIFEVCNGEYIPMIQANDRKHAESWCVLREPVKVAMTAI